MENRENVLSELENFRTQIETLQKLINENNREGLQEFCKRQPATGRKLFYEHYQGEFGCKIL